MGFWSESFKFFLNCRFGGGWVVVGGGRGVIFYLGKCGCVGEN